MKKNKELITKTAWGIAILFYGMHIYFASPSFSKELQQVVGKLKKLSNPSHIYTELPEGRMFYKY